MQTVYIKAKSCPAGDAQVAPGRQSLHFHGKRALAFHCHDYGCTAEAGVPGAKKESGRIFDYLQPFLFHSEYQKFLIRTETIFQYPQHAEHLPPFSFQRNHGIHQMFQ